jgi:hypothetical protein
MKWFLTVIALTLVIAAGTWFGGWPVVVVVGASWGVGAAHQRGAVATAVLAGAHAGGGLLAYDASAGPMGRLLQLFETMFPMPGALLVGLTRAYAALLCGASAALARSLRRLMTPA